MFSASVPCLHQVPNSFQPGREVNFGDGPIDTMSKISVGLMVSAIIMYRIQTIDYKCHNYAVLPGQIEQEKLTERNSGWISHLP